MKIQIEKLDNKGSGIGYIDNKIVFVPNSLPGETIDIDIIEDNKNYYIGKLNNVIKSSGKRVESVCPYFDKCNGCNLLNLCYQDTLKYKEQKVKEIFNKYLNVCDLKINLVECKKTINYRNKVIFHIKNGVFGFYDRENILLNINNCMTISDDLNKEINSIKKLNLKNGNVLLRISKEKEKLIHISTDETINIPLLKNIDNIIVNNKLVKGNDYIYETINNYRFKVSYKSFFQINNEINEKLFDIINDNIDDDSFVVDLCCGVGTLGICASAKVKKVVGIDNLKENIKDADINKEINSIKNIDFICGDSSLVENYKDANIVIIDPPRNGLNKNTLKSIMNILPDKIIYVSCDPFTLVRDLNSLLNEYSLSKYYLLDMFPYTHHVESICVLNKK